mgnify:CR=1 FL=1
MEDKEKAKLRRMQWEVAMNGNVQMQIWLGKQHLGQSEHPPFDEDDLCEGFDIVEIGSACNKCGHTTLAKTEDED